ncbi:MAG TPA: serine hydrolase domain-containing protein [Actinoplanes sp.]|nr:serine hydrolase domain-containing protein [Actinoplanes sp.]
MSLVPVIRDRAHAVGYRPADPLVVGVLRHGRPPAYYCQAGPTERDQIYTASVAKQVTAACVALLARSGALSLDGPIWQWLPELPPWANDVTIRNLVHHSGGLPFDVDIREADRTTRGVLHALGLFGRLAHPPDMFFDYSNPGYVCLGEIVHRACGEGLGTYARKHLFEPLGMTRTRFWSGPDPAPPGARPLEEPRPAPLSIGDGGMWSTAADLLRWCAGLNEDRLGLTAQLQKPGRLENNLEILPYAWGMGVHDYKGHRIYRHGGAWGPLKTLLVRMPDRGLGIVVFAERDDTDRRLALADAVFDTLLHPARIP